MEAVRIRLEQIQKTFFHRIKGAVTAVDNVSLEVEPGEFLTLLGPSGCGKTTTLRMIAGFETPTSGTIVLEGSDITYRPPNRRNVGMVFQSYALFPNMSVGDNVGFGLKVRKRPADQIRKRVGELLDLVHLGDKAARYPYQLSGGQQQRVALARALAFEPQVLLLDEPLSALDAKIRVTLRHEIRAIQRQLGITTVYVTHDQEEALSLSDRIVVMSDGRIEQIGTPFEVYNFPTTAFVASFVGTLNVLPAVVVDATGGRLNVGGQEIGISQAVSARAGSTLALALRPEMISLGSGPDGANLLRGTVADVSFLGSIVRLRIKIAEGIQVTLDVFNEPTLILPKLETSVTISFPAEGPLILESVPVIDPDQLVAEA